MQATNIPRLILSELTLGMVPSQPAIYAILSDGEAGSDHKRCRYVGFAQNLQDSILRHFQTSEPIIPLRYFMLSSKLKYLVYELVPSTDGNSILSQTEEWMERFNMESPSREKEETIRLSLA
ncbi:MAG: hypothetical protein WCO02_13170 [Bacteroidota bacterium]